MALVSFPIANFLYCLLMNVAYFFASFIASGRFCVEHIDCPCNIIANAFEIVHLIY